MDSNCEQIKALLKLYIADKLGEQLRLVVEYHLNTCVECRKLYFELKAQYDSTCHNDEILQNKDFYDEQYIHFRKNLSAYIDNELSDNENLKIRKITIANTVARQELEEIISLRQLLKSTFEKTKKGLKKDLSEETISALFNSNIKRKPVLVSTAFKLFILFLFIISLSYFILCTYRF